MYDEPVTALTILAAMLIRLAKPGDARALADIYNPQVLETTRTLDLLPRSEADQRRWIEDRSGGLAVLVAEIDSAVVGFGSLSFYRDRPGYRTSVEDSVYVADGHQGQGIGNAVLGALVDAAQSRGFHAMFARIVGPQEASVALHQRHGFDLVGIEREVARKFGRWHHVALMQRLL
jgi:phosphinothricin acetyltransferase